MAARLRLLPAGSKAPVVVYAHGCTGLDNFAFLERIAQAGFVVVAPNSFARRYRPLQCDPVTQTGGRNLFVYDFRLAEIAFALDKLWLRQWVDWERMLLVGTSEGGVAAALYRGNEFQGRVITQWTCAGAPHVAGIAAPLSEPILAVRSSVDPWYGPENAGDCQDSFGQRLNSRSYVVEGPVGHNVLSEPAVVELIAEFLVLRATGRGR
jgi:dienelactone hydrolase